MIIFPGNPLGSAIEGNEISLVNQAAGDTMYFNGTSWVRLAKGTALQLLRQNAGLTAPEWAGTGSAGGWVLVSVQEVTGSAATNIDFSSLAGNTDGQYMMQGFIKNGFNGAASILIQPNADGTAGNYGSRNQWNGASTGATAGVHLGVFSALNQFLFFDAFINARISATNSRSVWGYAISNGSITADLDGILWNNTANEITSIRVTSDGGASGLAIGSYVALWKRGA